MQAIETKYIGPSNYRGSRIKASCERGSITVTYDDSLNSEAAHKSAVDALIAKFCAQDLKQYGTPYNKNPWNRAYCLGGTKDGYVAVFCDEKQLPATYGKANPK